MGSQGRKKYTPDFKLEAVALVTQHGYSVAEAAKNLGVTAGLLRRWKTELGQIGTDTQYIMEYRTYHAVEVAPISRSDVPTCHLFCIRKTIASHGTLLNWVFGFSMRLNKPSSASSPHQIVIVQIFFGMFS